MSLTTKKINGTEYDYLEYYRDGKKKTMLLGKSGKPYDEIAKSVVLKVMKDRVFASTSKLWSCFDKFEISGFCESPFHREKDGLESWLRSRQDQYGIEKGQRTNVKELVNKLYKTMEALPLVTVVYEDAMGIKQIVSVCVMCLYRMLERYGSFGYKRRPKNLGVLLLNKKVAV